MSTDSAGRILDAVLTLLSQQGIGGVSMRAVAREADVALGLVNYHFTDKTGLVCAALRRIEDQDIALVEPDPELPPAERGRARQVWSPPRVLQRLQAPRARTAERRSEGRETR
ncbi:TetR/AcrR family transcriptional regulator [Lentzea sp. HUAS TT2]|uniref:TetR/AcrR family transcriptional regulator n=1 Tax=Lentzea sp. HUAS TT2 TaxID=3447454 RepID=UPI003F6F068E